MPYMLKIIFIGLLIYNIELANSSSEKHDAFNVMSFNIRYNTPKDGPNAWPNRKQHVSRLILFHQADIVGLQEATLGQLKDMSDALPDYTWTGRARDDGNTDSAGEYAAILYRQDKLSIIKQGTFWCSTTPTVPSKGWDTTYKRNINWAQFTHSNGSQFFLFNTHFDHKGKIAQTKCGKLLREHIDLIAPTYPIIVTGDFNIEPPSQAYVNLTNNKPYKKHIFTASSLSAIPAYGPAFTFTGFDIQADKPHPIDYIFVSDEFKVNRFGVLTDSLNNRLPSDHYPVLVEVELK